MLFVCRLWVILKENSFFKIVILVLVPIILVGLISSIWPRSEERFFEFSILGKEKTADVYFPNRNSILGIGSQVSWYIHVLNHLEGAQNVSIRVKFLNSTMVLPNDQKHEPSPYASFFELPLFLDVDDVLMIPFQWSILEAVSQNGSLLVQGLMVNDQVLEIDVSDSNSLFRIVFELWVYDHEFQQFTFLWGSEEDLSSASLNMAFNVIIPAL